MRSVTVGFAIALAIPLAFIMMSSIAHAEAGFLLPQSASDPISVNYENTVVVLTETDPVDLLTVFVGAVDDCCEAKTPVAGRYTLGRSAVSFTPAFGFDPGRDYVARVRVPGRDDELMPFRISDDVATVNAEVTAIYPSADTLPENVLRFYIHFSAPMQPHVAFDYIKLYDVGGAADEAAFMRFKQELWNEDRTRLTVLIDPGRIKRDVATNVELGPALIAGRQYTLAVDGGWPSADGRSVLSRFSKTFTVSDALRVRPDVSFWRASSPCRGSREPLELTFDRPFDRQLLGKDILVVAEGGRVISGEIHIGSDERSWSFVPDEPWERDHVRVVANAKLEDVAGNNFHDLLDHTGNVELAGFSSSELPISLNNCS